MLSANFAVDPIRTFPGIAPPKMQSQLLKPAVTRPAHALSVLEVFNRTVEGDDVAAICESLPL